VSTDAEVNGNGWVYRHNGGKVPPVQLTVNDSADSKRIQATLDSMKVEYTLFPAKRGSILPSPQSCLC
jgi:hypothetical protein